MKTHDPIGIKFCTVDYLSEMTPGAKFYANPSMGEGFSANGRNSHTEVILLSSTLTHGQCNAGSVTFYDFLRFGVLFLECHR